MARVIGNGKSPVWRSTKFVKIDSDEWSPQEIVNILETAAERMTDLLNDEWDPGTIALIVDLQKLAKKVR